MNPIDGDIFTLDCAGNVAYGGLVLDIRHFHDGSLGERAFICRDPDGHRGSKTFKALGRV